MNSTYKKLAISELKSKPFSAVKIFFLSFSRKKEFAHGLILKPSCFFGGGHLKNCLIALSPGVKFREKNKFLSGIWRFCRESGNLGSFPGNWRYYRDIERRFISNHSLIKLRFDISVIKHSDEITMPSLWRTIWKV